MWFLRNKTKGEKKTNQETDYNYREQKQIVIRAEECGGMDEIDEGGLRVTYLDEH